MERKILLVTIGVISLSFLLLSSLFFFFQPVAEHNTLTGSTSASAQGGNVTYLNITAKNATSRYWQGFVGEMIVDSSASSTTSALAKAGELTALNLTFSCTPLHIYATTDATLDIVGIAAGNTTVLDAYLGIPASYVESGNNTFQNTTSSFIISGSAISNVPSTYTNVYDSPGNTTFDLGFLTASETFYFATHQVSDLRGYDNETHDYQLLVPVNHTNLTVQRYYFYPECPVAAPTAPGAAPGGEELVCSPNWKCTGWSEPQRDLSTGECSLSRTCVDVNNCNKEEGKPTESQACPVMEEFLRECTEEDYSCSSWSSCNIATVLEENSITLEVKKRGEEVTLIQNGQSHRGKKELLNQSHILFIAEERIPGISLGISPATYLLPIAYTSPNYEDGEIKRYIIEPATLLIGTNDRSCSKKENSYCQELQTPDEVKGCVEVEISEAPVEEERRALAGLAFGLVQGAAEIKVLWYFLLLLLLYLFYFILRRKRPCAPAKEITSWQELFIQLYRLEACHTCRMVDILFGEDGEYASEYTREKHQLLVKERTRESRNFFELLDFLPQLQLKEKKEREIMLKILALREAIQKKRESLTPDFSKKKLTLYQTMKKGKEKQRKALWRKWHSLLRVLRARAGKWITKR